MSSYKFKHMTLDDRITIQKSLKEGKTFVEIGALLGKDPSTIAKEVKGHFEWKNTGTRSRGFNPCKHRRTCTRTNICIEADAGVLCSHKAWNRYSYCSECANCLVHCPDFAEEKCSKLEKPPYVCNPCKQVRSCTLSKRFYDAKEANKAYERTRSDSRKGIDLTAEELARLDKVITPLIKQGQSIHQICVNNADVIMVDERTIYNYIDSGVLSVGNIDLPRKVRYKKRKKKKSVRVDKKCHIGRTYEDFEAFMAEHPDYAVVEMDSVEGTRDSTKVLLTLFFRNSTCMLAYLREANTARSVTEIINEFIRRILPKKTSFKDLTQEKVQLMMNHINSYTRKKLNNRSAHQLFSFFYGEDIAEKLEMKAIPANEIILKPELLK